MELTKENMEQALKEFKDNMPTYLTEEDLNKSIEEMTSKLEKLDMSEEIKELKAAGELQGEAMTKLLAQNQTKEVKTLDTILAEKAEELKTLSGNSSGSLKFTVDKTTVTTAAVVNSTLAAIDPTIGRIKRARNVIRRLFNTTSMAEGFGATVRWVEYTLDTNNAAFQTEGAVKGEGAMAWIEKSAPIQLVAEWIKVSRQALSDFGFIAGEIRNKLMRDLEAKVDASLFSGTGTSPEIKGIYTYADTYTAVAAGITDPSIYDLIVKVHENISATTDYMPNIAIMNIVDINQMKLKKDANNNYVLPPFANLAGMEVDGMTVVESSKVTANTMLVGDFDFADLYNIGGVEITMGYENQDFTKNLITILAEERLALVVKGTDTGAFRKVASISAALAILDD